MRSPRHTSCISAKDSAAATTPPRCNFSSPAGHSTASALRCSGVEMKIVVADANLVPHRERFEAALPDAHVRWQSSGVSPDELRDADVYVGSRFTAAMADAAEK